MTRTWGKWRWALLDVAALPLVFVRLAAHPFGPRARAWARRVNAKGHVHALCKLCPSERRALRDVDGSGACAWNRAWRAGRYDAPPDFGARNFVTQYVGHTDLAAFREAFAQPTDEAKEC